MTKSEAKRKIKNREIQIIFDDKGKLELLRDLFDDNRIIGGSMFYFNNNARFTLNNDTGFDVSIIKISEITEDEEEVLNAKDYQFWCERSLEWVNLIQPGIKDWKFRLKPKPDFSKEIEALQQKAKENGMKAVITLEKL